MDAPVVGDAAAVLDGLARIAAPALVGRLPVRRLHVTAPLVLVVQLVMVRLLELWPGLRRRLQARRRPRRRHVRHEDVVVARRRPVGHAGTGRDAIDAEGVVEERLESLEVAELALDLLRDGVAAGRVHLKTTTFISILCTKVESTDTLGWLGKRADLGASEFSRTNLATFQMKNAKVDLLQLKKDDLR